MTRVKNSLYFFNVIFCEARARGIRAVCALLLIAACAGCAAKGGAEVSLNGEHAAKKKIAVLPFANMTPITEAGDIISDTYVMELFNNGKYAVEEPGNVRQFLLQEHVGVIGELEIAKIMLLGKRLKVDAVLVGTVEEYTHGRGYESPVVTVFARMVDTNSGKIVWVDKHSRNGEEYIWIFDFGLIRQPTMLARRVVSEMIETINW